MIYVFTRYYSKFQSIKIDFKSLIFFSRKYPVTVTQKRIDHHKKDYTEKYQMFTFLRPDTFLLF